MTLLAESVPAVAPPPPTPPPILTGEDYIRSLRGRGLRVFLFSELVDEPVDHPRRNQVVGGAMTERLARRLAGVETEEAVPEEDGYFERVFEPEIP
jgi:4-hydroxybutyryl-CoA dehydratase/vinylacetyl-CoA-Delta-isomerase